MKNFFIFTYAFAIASFFVGLPWEPDKGEKETLGRTDAEIAADDALIQADQDRNAANDAAWDAWREKRIAELKRKQEGAK